MRASSEVDENKEDFRVNAYMLIWPFSDRTYEEWGTPRFDRTNLPDDAAKFL